MYKRVRQSIPEPYESVHSLRNTALATKEMVETMAGQRGGAYDAAVTWGDLINLGLVKREQIPIDIGSNRI